MSDTEEQREITRLLQRIQAGNEDAADELFPLVYTELRRLARARMAREAPGHTLPPTALVHETYLRLIGAEEMNWKSRSYFFGAAAEAMRRILIEWARAKSRQKRGGDLRRTELDENAIGEAPEPEVLLALDRALSDLEDRDESMSDVVKLRYFAGLTVKETARALDVSPRTVNRRWSAARAWLNREMSAAG